MRKLQEYGPSAMLGQALIDLAICVVLGETQVTGACISEDLRSVLEMVLFSSCSVTRTTSIHVISVFSFLPDPQDQGIEGINGLQCRSTEVAGRNNSRQKQSKHQFACACYPAYSPCNDRPGLQEALKPLSMI